jgi:hypothetical protein
MRHIAVRRLGYGGLRRSGLKYSMRWTAVWLARATTRPVAPGLSPRSLPCVVASCHGDTEGDQPGASAAFARQTERCSYALSRVQMAFGGLVSGSSGRVLLGAGCWVADKTGRGRSGWRASSYEVTLPAGQGGPGGGRRIDLRPAWVRQPISGSGRPRERVLAGGRAEVGVDLAGGVTLEAADDLFLGQAFFGAPVGVGAGRRV